MRSAEQVYKCFKKEGPAQGLPGPGRRNLSRPRVGIPVSIRKVRNGEQLWMCFKEEGGRKSQPARRASPRKPTRPHDPETRVINKSCAVLRLKSAAPADTEGGLNHERDDPLGRKIRIPIHPLRRAHPRNKTCAFLPFFSRQQAAIRRFCPRHVKHQSRGRSNRCRPA